MKPTVIGGKPNAPAPAQQTPALTIEPAPIPAQAGTQVAVSISQDFPVALTSDETSQIAQKLASFDIRSVPLRDIAMLEQDPEKALNQVLDGFLARVDIFDNPDIYRLFKALNGKVDDSKLEQVADRILEGKVGLLEGITTGFKRFALTKKGREHALEEAWEETRRLVQGKTKTLVDYVHDLERRLATEEHRLEEEIATFEQLKKAYGQQFRGFAVSTAFLQALLAKAKGDVEALRAAADLNDPMQKAEVDELGDKLQALESRALALEGTLTRLPAEAVMIRQLQNAGIQTLSETTTTAMSRFASIKMTLVDLNGTMVIRSVQRVAQTGADLDRRLGAVQSRLAKQVVTTAANAPGDNRVAQAEQIKKIVEDTRAIVGIVDAARASNTEKFGQARATLKDARDALVAVSQQVQPGAPLAR